MHVACDGGLRERQHPRLQERHQLLQLLGGHVEGGHSCIRNAVENSIAQGTFTFRAGSPGTADGGCALASQTVLAVTARASNIESRASGFYRVGRRGGRSLGVEGQDEERDDE